MIVLSAMVEIRDRRHTTITIPHYWQGEVEQNRTLDRVGCWIYSPLRSIFDQLS